MNLLVAAIGGYSIAQVAIFIVIVAAVIALVMVALRQFKVQLPPWIVQIFWILLVAFIVIAAIRFLLTM